VQDDAPILDEIRDEYGKSRRHREYERSTTNPRTPMKFNVRGFPTLILSFKNGPRPRGQKIGASG